MWWLHARAIQLYANLRWYGLGWLEKWVGIEFDAWYCLCLLRDSYAIVLKRKRRLL